MMSLNAKIFLWISTIRINWSAPTNDNSNDSSFALLLAFADEDLLGVEPFIACKWLYVIKGKCKGNRIIYTVSYS